MVVYVCAYVRAWVNGACRAGDQDRQRARGCVPVVTFGTTVWSQLCGDNPTAQLHQERLVPMPSRNRRPSAALDISLGGGGLDCSAPGVGVLAG